MMSDAGLTFLIGMIILALGLYFLLGIKAFAVVFIVLGLVYVFCGVYKASR